jgi:hypothetical protein
VKRAAMAAVLVVLLALLLMPAEALAVPSHPISEQAYLDRLPGGRDADWAKSIADAMEQARLDGSVWDSIARGYNPCESWDYYIYYPNNCDPSTNLPYNP